MVAIHTPASRGTVYTPVMKTCRVATDRGMIRPPGFAWVRINAISSLWPDSQFRAEAIKAAKQFVADMERQGLELITAEADMLVYGPIRHRDFSGAGAPTWRPAPGADPTFKAGGFAFSEDPDSDWEDFLLRAEFLSSRVHMVEYIIKDTSL
jgi:hypothetical protein